MVTADEHLIKIKCPDRNKYKMLIFLFRLNAPFNYYENVARLLPSMQIKLRRHVLFVKLKKKNYLFHFTDCLQIDVVLIFPKKNFSCSSRSKALYLTW